MSEKNEFKRNSAINLGLSIEKGKMASESSVDSMWMDNLEEWVGDQNEVVTVKSLSRGLKVRSLHVYYVYTVQ